MRDLNVALIKDEISWQDPAVNRRRYQRHFTSIQDMDGKTVAWMRENASQSGAVITGSLIMEEKDHFVNRMIWVMPDGDLRWYDKRHLFRFGGEHHHYHAGNQQVIVELAGWRLALFICYDRRIPVWSRNREDYDAGIYVANWPNARDSFLVARAIENQPYIIGANRIGSNPNGDEYSGGSVILDFLGQPIEDSEDHVTIAKAFLSMQALQDSREHFPAALDRDTFEFDY